MDYNKTPDYTAKTMQNTVTSRFPGDHEITLVIKIKNTILITKLERIWREEHFRNCWGYHS